MEGTSGVVFINDYITAVVPYMFALTITREKVYRRSSFRD
jgi:hypothetical protein